jgi:hypothetical protein
VIHVKKGRKGWVLVLAIQGDRGSKPALGKSFMRPYLENAQNKKRLGGVAQGVGPEFKPHYCKHNTKT